MKVQLSGFILLVLTLSMGQSLQGQNQFLQDVQTSVFSSSKINTKPFESNRGQGLSIVGLYLHQKKRQNQRGTISKPVRNSFSNYSNTNLMPTQSKQQSFNNRRLKYSSLWVFTSLNYLYADLIGLMDFNLLNQYQTGIVNGIEITPAFLTAAAAYMQIPLSNVFLPQVIKNENLLRWIQIISGTIATLAQGATLFVGKPSPYYLLFSVIEMGVTTYITIDAIKWKPDKKEQAMPLLFK